MCEACGCTVTRTDDPATIEVLGRLLGANDRVAAHNRDHFNDHRVVAFNLMSSPGSGKTALLEATIDALKSEFRIAVIEGDLETDNDARRIRGHGVPAVQITTGSACHLDAPMIHDALHDLSLSQLDIVFIENVGNLVCPASFDLGQHRNVVLLSVTEGDDKPAKYPVIFRGADAVLLTKIDLAAVMDDFEPSRAEKAIRDLANAAPVMSLSARKAINLETWTAWLRSEVANVRALQSATHKSHDAHHHDDHHHHAHHHGGHHHDHEHQHNPAVA
jgi:hydrogenase nickel incorporation protein HypB